MDLDTLKKMALTQLVQRHVLELQTASTPEALASFALAFRDELADVMQFDPTAPVASSEAQVGLKMS